MRPVGKFGKQFRLHFGVVAQVRPERASPRLSARAHSGLT